MNRPNARTHIALVGLLFGLGCATPQLGDKALPDRPENLRAAFDAMPASADARVRLLEDNIDSWVARMNVLESAKHTIDVQYFIVEADAHGLALLGLLAEKARAGVQVRLMVDARGSVSLIRSADRYLLQEVKRAGADVRVYNPILWQLSDTVARGDLRSVAASNHDKMIVVDGRSVVAGGRNMSKDYLNDPRDQKNAFIDMDAFYEGASAATRYTEAFTSEFGGKHTSPLLVEPGVNGERALHLALAAMRQWLRDPAYTAEELASFDAEDDAAAAARVEAVGVAVEGSIVGAEKDIPADDVRAVVKRVSRHLAKAARLRGAAGRAVPQISDDAVAFRLLDTRSAESGHLKNTVNENLLLAILAAEKRLVIQSPYFVLTERGIRALELVAARGVAITILTNSPASSDSPPTQAAFLRQWPGLLARVPTARLFVVAEGRLMHAKVGVVDDQIAFVGSYNLDPLSAGVNGEVVGALWSTGIAQHITGLIDTRIAGGGVVEYTLAKDAGGNVVVTGGVPVVAFGPEQHCTAEQLKAAKDMEPVLELLAPLL